MLETSSPRMRRRNCRRSSRRDIRPRRTTSLRQTCSNEFKRTDSSSSNYPPFTHCSTPHLSQFAAGTPPPLLFNSRLIVLHNFCLSVCFWFVLPDFIGRFFTSLAFASPPAPPPALLCCRGLPPPVSERIILRLPLRGACASAPSLLQSHLTPFHHPHRHHPLRYQSATPSLFVIYSSFFSPFFCLSSSCPLALCSLFLVRHSFLSLQSPCDCRIA